MLVRMDFERDRFFAEQKFRQFLACTGQRGSWGMMGASNREIGGSGFQIGDGNWIFAIGVSAGVGGRIQSDRCLSRPPSCTRGLIGG